MAKKGNSDIRFPDSLFDSAVIDSKQTRAMAKGILGLDGQDEKKVDNVIKDLLLSIGADLFATPQREHTYGLHHQVSRSHNLVEDMSLNETTPSRKKPFFMDTIAVHKQYKPSSLPPLTLSVPSHILPPKATFIPTVYGDDPKEKGILYRKANAREISATNRARFRDTKLSQTEMQEKRFRLQQEENRLLFEELPVKLHGLLVDNLESRSKVKIVVVGAGLAGLSAANKLLAQGFKDVTVLEATPRAGGRIKSKNVQLPLKELPFVGRALPKGSRSAALCKRQDLPPVDLQSHLREDVICDLGFSSIDFPGPDNVVYTLAKSGGLLRRCNVEDNPSPKTQIMGPNRVAVSSPYRDLSLPYTSAIKREVDLVYREVCQGREVKDVCLSGKDYERERRRRLKSQLYDHVTGTDISNCENLKLSWTVLGLMSDANFMEDDSDSDRLAADLLGSHDVVFGGPEKVYMKRGMISVVDLLVKKIGAKRIKYNMGAWNIDYSEFTLKNKRQNFCSKVAIDCHDGRPPIRADHVIVAIPLGFLKHNVDTLFTPALPETKRKAISNIGWSASSKAILVFDQVISSRGIDFIWPGSPSMGQQSKLLACAFRLKSHPFCKQVLILSCTKPDLEDMPDSDISEEVTEILKVNLKLDVKPTSIHKSKWTKSTWTRGLRPYLTTKCDGQVVSQLAEPITFEGRPLVQFAGDATYKSYRSLTNAARASGIREADRLCSIYNDLYKYANIM